jgi:hypothetical protein
MVGRGWHEDERGRWRAEGGFTQGGSTLTVAEGIKALLGVPEEKPMLGDDSNVGGPENPSQLAKTVDVAVDVGVSEGVFAPFSNPTRSWARGAPGSRGGELAGRKRTEPRDGFVYFFQGDTTGRIKIGFSTDPKRRLEEIRSGASERMRLLGSLPGTTGDEASYHRANSSAHVLNEWFSPEVLPQVAGILGVPTSTLVEIPFV